MNNDLRVHWLGRMEFANALALQEKLVGHKWTNYSLGDAVLLLEHEPVYPIGRTPDQTSMRGDAQLPHQMFPIKHGGQATHHGLVNRVAY